MMKKNIFLLLTGWLLLHLVSNAYSTLCKPGWVLSETTCYKVGRKRVAWNDAEEACNTEHTGHLAAIFTAQHQAFIKCLISNSTDTFWIGLKRKQNGKLQWSTRLKFTLDNRYGKYAKLNDLDKCYGIMNKDRGLWKAVNCSRHHYFICQYSSSASSGLGRWKNVISKILSSLETLRAWLLMDRSNPTPSACTEYIVNSKQVTGNGMTSNKPGPSKQSIHQGDHRVRKNVKLRKKDDIYSGSAEQMPKWHYKFRTKMPKATLVQAFSSSTKTLISSPHSEITSTLISTKGSKDTTTTTISQATQKLTLLTTDRGRVRKGKGSGSGSEKTTTSAVAVTLSISITPNYTKTNTTSMSSDNSRDTSPPMMLTTSMTSVSAVITKLDVFNQSAPSQNVTVNHLLPSTSSSRPITLSPGIQKRKNENHYNPTPIITKVTTKKIITTSKPLGVENIPSEQNAIYTDASKQPISFNLLTTISNNLKKSNTTIFSPTIQKNVKGNRVKLTPIISHIGPNSTPWSNHHQSPILTMFHHIFSKLNNATYKLDGNTSKIVHTTIHNRSWSDAIIASLKKKLSGKTVQERVKELIRDTLGRHLKHSTRNGLPPIDLQNTMFNPRLANFGDFFKIVDYFVNICHQAEWKKNELEGIVKEIAENTDPFLKSSLSGRTLERYTNTLDYVDIEVMHVGVSHVGNVNCHGKNGKWNVGKLKLLSKTEINETISISMILLNTPAISINSTNKNGDGPSFLVSPLLSIVAFGDQRPLQISHTFSLTINRNVSRNTNSTETGNAKEEYDFSCVFLDIATGLWSDFGCEVTKEAISQISCSCNHTTNFAILMQVRNFQISKEEELTLSTISYIGCSISLITQFITIAVFTFIEILRCERTFVHRNLCLAIVGAQITFLAGIKAVKYKIVCSMIALLLHYCYMSVFAWMLVEGLHLYSRVVRVFGSELYRKIYYSIFGWGMPVLLVVISAAADWDGYGTDTVCWLSIGKDTIWAFVGPALAIITVNIVILICVTRIVMTSAKHGKQGQFDHVRAGVKGALFLIPILGMTWVFGLLSVNRNLIIFQYLFAVSNSLQGFFIFLFHVVLNSEVRQALTRLRERRSLQKGDLSSTSSTSSNTSWNTKSISEKAPRRWSRRVSPAQTGTSGTTSTA